MTTVTGTTGPDILDNSGGELVIDGLAGDDTLTAFRSGADLSSGNGFMFFILVELFGRDGADILTGFTGADWLYGGPGDDIVNGKAGWDHIIMDDGIDTTDGGAGRDRIDFSQTSGTQTVEVNLATGVIANDGFGNAETIQRVEFITGSTTTQNILTGNTKLNELAGGALTDILDGGAGRDYLYGSDGGDTYIGGAGNDWLNFGGLETTQHNSLTNTNFTGPSNGVDIDLGAGAILDDGYGNAGVVQTIENVSATQFADTLTGDAENNIFQAGAGGDTIDGGAGKDTFKADYLPVGVRVDLAAGTYEDLNGGNAGTLTDIENAWGHVGSDILLGDSGDNELIGTRLLTLPFFTDAISAPLPPSDDVIRGRGGDDVIKAQAGPIGQFQVGADDLYGGAGKDRIFGGFGEDELYGGGGQDRLFGGTEDDRLDGGGGNDRMKGDAGADTFIYGAKRDRILDFEDDTDTVELDAAALGIVAGTSGAVIVGTYGTTVGTNVALDFGGGDVLVFVGVTDETLLANDLLAI